MKESMKKIVLFIPYFGKFPDNFDVWKKTAIANCTIDFVFITDIDLKDEKNIKVVKMSFEDLKKKISDHLGFNIICNTPYKLCDYRPCFGDVFQKYCKNFDFWGYCDIDLIFGNIRQFITDDILEKHERILINGHLSLYKNIDKMNYLYKSDGVYPEYNYKEVYSTNDSVYFDEFYGMELKCYRNKVKVYQNGDLFIDIIPKSTRFLYKGNPCYYEYQNGKLNVITQDTAKEVMYVHFQKRKMNCKIDDKVNHFVLYPNVIENIDITKIREYMNVDLGKPYMYKQMIKKTINSIKRYGIKKVITREKRRRQILKYKSSLLKK